MNEELKHFAEIVRNVTNGNFTEAAKIVNEANFCAIDLIRINEDAKTGFLVYEDEEDHYDVINPLEKETFIALFIEKANNLKTKENGK